MAQRGEPVARRRALLAERAEHEQAHAIAVNVDRQPPAGGPHAREQGAGRACPCRRSGGPAAHAVLRADVGALREQEANHGEMRGHDSLTLVRVLVGEARMSGVLLSVACTSTSAPQSKSRTVANHCPAQTVLQRTVPYRRWTPSLREEELDDVAPIRLDGPSEQGPTCRVRDDVA